MSRRSDLLELDPDLAIGLDPAREILARAHLRVRIQRVGRGPWDPATGEFSTPSGLGLLIVDGFAVRELALAHRVAAELLGPGDITRPWDDDGEHIAYPFSFSFRVLEPLSLAVLDEDATRKLMHFPEIVGLLMARVMARSRRVVGHLVIAQLASVDERIHVALWHMADRFGRVGIDGVVMPLRLTHEILGRIVGARRPSVTAALGRLNQRGLVAPRAAGGWLLCGDPPQRLERQSRIATKRPASVGTTPGGRTQAGAQAIASDPRGLDRAVPSLTRARRAGE
jgi:CRP-like cAMP-binding protein